MLWLFLAAIPAFDVDKHVLPNGLEVILSEDHRLPIVAVNVVYHVGAIDEPRDRTGFAHLFEHLMFQGSAHVADEAHFQILSDAGASAVNAETGYDYTEYYETVPSNALATALWLESDRMGFLLEALDQATLDNQREVVKNERRQNVEDTPYGRVEEATLKALFPRTHPYADGIIGSMAHLQAATLDDARAFFHHYYAPANATLTIVGDVDKHKAMKLVEQYFGALPGEARPRTVRPAVPEQPAQARIVVDEPVGKVPKLWFSWVTAAAGDDDEVALNVLAEVLAGGKASRLYRALVQGAAVAQDVSTEVEVLRGGSVFEIAVTPLLGVDAAKLERAASQALDGALAQAVTPAELARVVARDETTRLIDLESPGGDDGIANLLQRFNHYAGDPKRYQQQAETYRALTPERLSAVAKRWLTPKRRLTTLARPVSAAAAAEAVTASPQIESPRTLIASKDFRGAQPTLAAEPKFTLPVFQKAQLDNGIQVFVIEDHSSPLVALSVGIQAGAAFDPPGRTGASAVLFEWMQEGAGDKDGAALDEAFGALGSALDISVSRDGAFVETIVTGERLAPAFGLVADVVLRPTFDKNALRALKTRLLAQRQEALSDIGFVGIEELSVAIFSEVHPYGRPRGGSTPSINALEAGDLQQFYAQHVTTGGTAIVAVGDTTLSAVKALAENAFSTMRKGERARVAITPLPPHKFKALRLIEQKNVEQSFIGLGTRTIAYGHGDRDALDLASELFAGLFNSRLNLRLREELGITYGAAGTHALMRDAGAFVAFAQVRGDATALGVKESLAVLRGLKARPFSDAELKSAKASFLRSLPGRFTHRFDMAGGFAALSTLGADVDVWKRWPDRVRAVSLDKLRRVTAQYLQPDNMQLVLVGDAAKAKAALESLPIEEISREHR